ncbi:hypothetical protein OF83DRAFT_557772 [Amylostereum chailletii]|nr:hypothetical protein OF83DRAFT_557772 [Amylostereum chailletii]
MSTDLYYNTTTLILDDRDPNIHYKGSWEEKRTSNEYQDTTTGSLLDISNCSFQFGFLGTAVEVFGTLGNSTPPPVVKFQIDDLPWVIYQPEQDTTPIYKLLFYSSITLSDGHHNLTATVLNQQIFWFDYLLYTPSPPTETSGTSSLSSSSSLSFLSGSPTPAPFPPGHPQGT